MPILLMSGDSPTEKKIQLLNEGADDYIAKPFAIEEMSARLRALLRRPRNLQIGEIQIDDLVLDEANAKVIRAGKLLRLTTKEFALLQYLMKNPGRVLSHQMIIEHVWDGETDELSNMVKTHIY